MTRFHVEVRRIGTDEVVRSLGPMDERRAEKVERGLHINLDYERFYTEIVSSEITLADGDDIDHA